MASKKQTLPRFEKKSRQRTSLSGKSAHSLKDEEKSFPIVGIGASAGGLRASEQFFASMAPDSGAAFVLIPHLDPSHANILPDLWKKYTRMTVVQTEDGNEAPARSCPRDSSKRGNGHHARNPAFAEAKRAQRPAASYRRVFPIPGRR